MSTSKLGKLYYIFEQEGYVKRMKYRSGSIYHITPTITQYIRHDDSISTKSLPLNNNKKLVERAQRNLNDD
ncbi:hypothetical protein G9A89_001319 [Geosiphon pyriformis]|nr:hypothetical protein G9A89_001319 [Geosiphon pyriformis]